MFDRVEAIAEEIRKGNVSFAMMIADFHLIKGTIPQSEYDELALLAYPVVEVVAE